MTTDTRPPSTEPTGYSAGAVGVTAFAAVLLIMAGLLQAIQGVVALVNDTFFVVGTEYVFTFDVTSWGWVHLAIGLVLVLVGVALLRGSLWARIVGVALACLSIVVNFLWLPYYPLWSLTVIAFDLLVIWALVAHGKDISRA
ncbi:MAG TPA: hypothetical protein VES95_14035 [Dermatophilaceae bacterium]|nr:hypothetical protein [Dermatophilaceae bacterium]